MLHQPNCWCPCWTNAWGKYCHATCMPGKPECQSGFQFGRSYLTSGAPALSCVLLLHQPVVMAIHAWDILTVASQHLLVCCASIAMTWVAVYATVLRAYYFVAYHCSCRLANMMVENFQRSSMQRHAPSSFIELVLVVLHTFCLRHVLGEQLHTG